MALVFQPYSFSVLSRHRNNATFFDFLWRSCYLAPLFTIVLLVGAVCVVTVSLLSLVGSAVVVAILYLYYFPSVREENKQQHSVLIH
jgi:hypothetical protein